MRTLLKRQWADRGHTGMALAARALQTVVDRALAQRDAAIALRVAASDRDQPNGYPGLDVTGKLTSARFPFGTLPGQVCEASDVRLADARPPLVHGHVQADITGLVADLLARVVTTDARLSDARPPLAHGHGQTDVAGLVTDLAARVLGSDARLSDARTPLFHTHAQADVADLVAALAARPPMISRRTTQDYVSTVTGLADVPELDFPGLANTDYGFLLVLLYQSAATTTGVSLSMNGPASPLGRGPAWESGVETVGGPSSSATQVKAQTAADMAHTTAMVDAANATRVARFFGAWPVGGTGGPIRPRFASEVAGSTVTIKRGSWLLAF